MVGGVAMIFRVQTGKCGIARFVIPSIVFYETNDCRAIQFGIWKWTLEIGWEKK